jgi:hypothetical protein
VKLRERARKEGVKVGVEKVITRTEKEFINTLASAMGLLHSNVAPLRNNHREL